MTTPASKATPVVQAESIFKKLEKYVATEAHRVLAYVVLEAGAWVTLAHVSSTSLEHEITAAGAAAIAALVNHARQAHLIP